MLLRPFAGLSGMSTQAWRGGRARREAFRHSFAGKPKGETADGDGDGGEDDVELGKGGLC